MPLKEENGIEQPKKKKKTEATQPATLSLMMIFDIEKSTKEVLEMFGEKINKKKFLSKLVNEYLVPQAKTQLETKISNELNGFTWLEVDQNDIKLKEQ